MSEKKIVKTNAKGKKRDKLQEMSSGGKMLDLFLTLMTFFLLGYFLWLLYSNNKISAIKEFCSSIVITAVLVPVCKKIFALIHPFLASKKTSTRQNARKYGDQGWQFVVHVGMTIYEAYLLSSLCNWEWFNDINTIFTPLTTHQHSQIHLFYIIQLGIWFAVALSHKFIESKRKDYFVMYGHHVVTISLITLSYINNWYIVGLLVLYAHDFSDIFVDMLKLCVYIGWEESSYMFATEFWFVTNLIAWIYWRLYRYPLIIRGTFAFDNPYIQGVSTPEIYEPQGNTYIVCQILCCILFLMHIYWFFLFIRIAHRMIYASNAEGEKEYEDDTDDEDDKQE